MPFGFFDTTHIDFPANVDAAYIEGLRNRAGVSFPDVLREIDTRIRTFAGSLDPQVAELVTPTTEPYVDDVAPTAFAVKRRSEYGLPRPQVTDDSAIMLPLYDYDVSTAWTEDALEATTRARMLNQIDSILLGFRVAYRRETFRRLFSAAEERVAPRSASTNPGFAGSGTGLNVFSRSYPDGSNLPNGYTHYYAANISNAGELKTVLMAAVTRLRKWYSGPFDLAGNQAMIDLVTAITGTSPADSFVSAGTLLVAPANGVAQAQVDPNEYVGVLFGDIRVKKPITDTAAPNIAIYKTFGPLNPMNPLAWRYDETQGRDPILRYRDLYPLSQAVVKQKFGIGTNNRVSTALIYAAAGATEYVAPTDLDG